MNKLDAGNKHLLRLVRQGTKADGWAPVSQMLWPLVAALPSELVELQPEQMRVRLTAEGNTIVDWT